MFDRRFVAGGGGAVGEARDQLAQALEHRRIDAVAFDRERVVQQSVQSFLPARGRLRRRQVCTAIAQQCQEAQRPIERVRRLAFQRRPRRDAGDVLVGAAGVAQQQAIERELEGVGVVAGCHAVARAIGGVQAPARTRVLQPVLQQAALGFVERKARGDRGHREQVEHVADRRRTQRQLEQAQECFGQRRARQRAGVGERVGQFARAAGGAAEHRFDMRRVEVDVRREHGDVARLQRRFAGRRRRVEQRAQLVVQHLHFAQARVAGVELQAGVETIDLRARPVRIAVVLPRCSRCAADAVLSSTSACRRPSSVAAGGSTNGVDSNVAAMASPLPSVAMKSRPAWPHAASSGLARPAPEEAVVIAGCVVRVPACEVAPERARRRVQVEVLGARARLAGDHLQHVGRDVLAGEHEQARRQSPRRLAVRAEPLQVRVDAARAMLAPACDLAPQRRLPVVGRRAALPRQQPVAAPGLVFLEGVGQRAGERPRLERIAIGLASARITVAHVSTAQERGERGRWRLLQRAQQVPAQDLGPEAIFRRRRPEVGIERDVDEFAGRHEAQVGADAQALGQRLLQPAAHRVLRHQHQVRSQPVAIGGQPRGFLGEQPGQHLERIGVVEAEIGCGRHRHAVCRTAVASAETGPWGSHACACGFGRPARRTFPVRAIRKPRQAATMPYRSASIQRPTAKLPRFFRFAPLERRCIPTRPPCA